MAKVIVYVREVTHAEFEMDLGDDGPDVLDEGDLIEEYIYRRDHGLIEASDGSISSDVDVTLVEVRVSDE